MRTLFLATASRAAAGVLRLWIIVGLLLRVTRLRDWFHPLAIVFYTTPWPVMAAGFLVLALHAWRTGHRHALHRYVIFTAGALFTWSALSWRSSPDSGAPGHLRVAIYNVGRPTWRLPHLAAWLHEHDPDVMALAEALPGGRPKLAEWQQAFPDYQLLPLSSEMLCLVKGEVESAEGGDLGPGSGYGLSKVRVRGVSLTLLQADIDAKPTADRTPAFRRLSALAEAHRQERLLIFGDFNTPRESVHFDQWRRDGFLHAFEQAGTGFAETWPMPLPMLSLDHLWSTPSLRPLRCRIGYLPWSDHRPVIAEFDLR